MLDIIVSILVILGGFFALVGSIGLVKFRDTFMRLHGPAKATTLGVGGVLLGSVLYFSALSGKLAMHEFLILVFLFLTAPISAHMMAKAALHRRLRSECEIPGQSQEGATPNGGGRGAQTELE